MSENKKDSVMHALNLDDLDQVNGGLEEIGSLLNDGSATAAGIAGGLTAGTVYAAGSRNAGTAIPEGVRMTQHMCIKCGCVRDFILASGGRGHCRICGEFRDDL